MAYAIYRVAKLKTAGAVQAVGQHNKRLRATLNANPAVPNRVLKATPLRPEVVAEATSEGAGSDPAEPAQDAQHLTVWKAVQARIVEAGAKVRSNSVLACEVFIGASPEYFRPEGGPAGTWDHQRLEAWVPLAMRSLVEEWGDDNVVSAILHLDETTPHVQAVVVPIDPVSQRLNARRWLGGRKALAQFQDRHGQIMQAVGLQRGIRGSQATHQNIQAWYNQMQAPMPEVPEAEVQADKSLFQSLKEFARQETERIQTEQEPAIDTLTTQARERHTANKRRVAAEQTSQRLLANQAREQATWKANEAQQRREIADLTEQRDVLSVERDALKARLATYRSVPLAEAAGWFDPAELATARVRIGKDAQGRDRIFDAENKVVGRNAIDLTMQVHQCKMAPAVAWIELRQGAAAAEQAMCSNLETLREVSLPLREQVRDPANGWKQQRTEFAEQQVALRRPSTWEAVQGIYQRVRLALARRFGPTPVTYTLSDTRTSQPAEAYDPQQSTLPEGTLRGTFFAWLQIWRRHEEHDRRRHEEERLRREQEEAAQRQALRRGPSR